MFDFIKNKIKKIYNSVTQQFSSVFSRNIVDKQFLSDLSDLLISADTGVKTTQAIITKLADEAKSRGVSSVNEVKPILEDILVSYLDFTSPLSDPVPQVLLIVGINGSGKTSFIAKYANLLRQQGKRVLVVAGDTFRAAATSQLAVWTERVGVDIFVGRENQDPAAVVFDACKKFKDEAFDHIIIDTAGRLQNKINLMRELEKVGKIIKKQLPESNVDTWLTIDAMLGQNSLSQAEVFHESTTLNGLILTKLDGTGKGGIVFAITQKLHIPIMYVCFGEHLEDIKLFNAKEYVYGLLHE